MAITENRVTELQERLREVMKCEQLNKQQFMKITDIKNIGRKLDGKVAITKVDISKMRNSLLVNDEWFETGIGPMYLPEKIEAKAKELDRMSGNRCHQVQVSDDFIKKQLEQAAQHIKNDNTNSAFSVFANVLGDYNSQSIMSGTNRAAEREELSYKEKNAQLIQIINAKDEIIKSKDREIKLLRKIRADNGIEV